MAEAEEVNGGLILRGEDGSLYFIRDEVLEACKTDGVYRERVDHMLEGGDEVAGFALNIGATQFQPLRRVQVEGTSPISPKGDWSQQSTIMCPW